MPRGNPDLKLDNKRWPQAREERLRRMFAQGCTDEQIARELEITVRAVIGKRLRLKLRRWNKDEGPLEAALRRAQREKR